MARAIRPSVQAWASAFVLASLMSVNAAAQSPSPAPSVAPSVAPNPQLQAPAPSPTEPAPTSAAQPAAPSTPPPAEPTPEQREKAREAYTRGQQLFADGKFQDAEAAFAEAYAAVPNPVVLLSTAECAVRLGKLEDAYAALTRYLKERPDAPDRAEVEQKAAELAAVPASLALSSEPPGAAIKLDGQDTGKVTSAELSVKHGAHTLTIELAGYEPSTETIDAHIGARYELHAVLKAIPKPSEAQPPPADLKVGAEARPPDPTTALWITSIVGASGLITGTVLGFMVLAERSDYDAKPTESGAKRGERLALFTDVAFGIGAMALVTGAVLYFTADHAEPTPAPKASLQIAPAAFAHGAALAARGRF